MTVEIDGHEDARLIQEHRIDGGDKRLTDIVAAGKVPSDHFIGDQSEASWRLEPVSDPDVG